MSANSSSAIADAAVVPSRIVAAWAENDGDAFAEQFTEDATLILPNDVYLSSKEEIRAFMTKAFAGPYRGTRVYGEPLSARSLGSDVVVVVTRGGVLVPGEEQVAAERAIRATWVLAKQGDTWLIGAYQNTPIGA